MERSLNNEKQLGNLIGKMYVSKFFERVKISC